MDMHVILSPFISVTNVRTSSADKFTKRLGNSVSVSSRIPDFGGIRFSRHQITTDTAEMRFFAVRLTLTRARVTARNDEFKAVVIAFLHDR